MQNYVRSQRSKATLSFFVTLGTSLLASCGSSSASNLFHPGVQNAICLNQEQQQDSGSAFAAGSGTDADPFIICSAAQLNSLAQDATFLRASFQLGADIDLADFDGSTTAKTFNSIGSYDSASTSGTPFSGTFDGNGFAIQHLTLSSSDLSSATALFAFTSGAVVKNLSLTSASVSGGDNTALLVGEAQDTSFENISVQGSLNQPSGRHVVGGMVGEYQSTLAASHVLQGCTSHVTMTVSDTVGGLVGRVSVNNGATLTISNSQTSGSMVPVNVNGNTFGGLLGYAVAFGSTLAIANSSSTMSVKTEGAFSGGFVGTLGSSNGSSVSVDHCFFNGQMEVTAQGFSGAFNGGFIGIVGADASTTSITHSHSSGTFTNDLSFNTNAGFVGSFSMSNSATALVDQSFTAMTLSSPSGGYLTAGFAAQVVAGVTISNSYSTAVVQAHGTTITLGAGFVSTIAAGATIENCYSATDLTSVTPGGNIFAGFTAANYGTITHSFWNTDLVLTATGVGQGTNTVTAATTTSLRQQGTFTGWAFPSIWAMASNGYPTLVQ